MSDSIPWREAFPEYEDMPAYSVALKGFRKMRGLTQTALAEKTGIPQVHISAMERGKVTIGKERAKRLAEALDAGYRVFLQVNHGHHQKTTHPGAIIRHDYMAPLKLSVTRLATHIGISRNSLSRVINEKTDINPGLALRLSRAFNTSPELWLNLQQKRDLWEAKSKPQIENILPLYPTPESQV